MTTVTTQISRKYNARWTLQTFLLRAKEIHGDKYNYSLINSNHIKNKYSYVPVQCNQCLYQWLPSVHGHISSKNGCPSCAGNIGWDLTRFIMIAKNIHGDKYDYSLISESDIKNAHSKPTIKCNLCVYQWNPTIINHIHNKSGCPNCAGVSRWTFESFLQYAKQIHNDKYDYSLIKTENVYNAESKMLIICKNCLFQWYATIDNHINGKTGCPNCHASKGENECKRVLTKLGIPFNIQFGISNSRKKYDFILLYNGQYFILEYDGEQHFKYSPYFHQNMENFEIRKQRDIQYTLDAIKSNYKIIRIDYTQEKHIEQHIINALNLGNIYYLSSQIYSHITEHLL